MPHAYGERSISAPPMSLGRVKGAREGAYLEECAHEDEEREGAGIQLYWERRQDWERSSGKLRGGERRPGCHGISETYQHAETDACNDLEANPVACRAVRM